MSIESRRNEILDVARGAIIARLGRPYPEAIIDLYNVPDDPGALILHLNSGGNALEIEGLLQARGFKTEPNDAYNEHGYGVQIKVREP